MWVWGWGAGCNVKKDWRKAKKKIERPELQEWLCEELSKSSPLNAMRKRKKEKDY